jgi:uncharacterized membrane protein
MKFLNIIFAPLFVLLIHYFEFRSVVLLYLVMAVSFFVYMYRKKSSYKELVVPLLYVVVLSVAYYFSSLHVVKYIPVSLSMIFTLVFVDSHYNNKHMVLSFTKKFYKKELKEKELEFLKKGDFYWILVMLVNTLIHLYIVNYSSDLVWAFYSSIGWYGYFFGALIAQILYIKAKSV